jgi:hypothetical protein
VNLSTKISKPGAHVLLLGDNTRRQGDQIALVYEAATGLSLAPGPPPLRLVGVAEMPPRPARPPPGRGQPPAA